jgi:DNA replication protein DnaC
MDLNDEQEKYRLEEGIHDKIYAFLRKEAFFNAQPSAKPVCIVLGGQPGSGKTGLVGNVS